MATSDSGRKFAELLSGQPGSAVMILVLALNRVLPPPRTLLVF